jgi:hypothetical protein
MSGVDIAEVILLTVVFGTSIVWFLYAALKEDDKK